MLGAPVHARTLMCISVCLMKKARMMEVSATGVTFVAGSCFPNDILKKVTCYSLVNDNVPYVRITSRRCWAL